MNYLIVAGITMFGYLLPEFLFLLGARDGVRQVPVMQNVISAAAAALIAVGVFLR